MASWLVTDILDPVENLIEKGLASADAVVVTAAKAAQVATTPAPPAAPDSIVSEAEAALQTLVDGVIEAGLGRIPIVGELLEGPAVAIANDGLDYVEAHISAYISSLVSSVKGKLTTALAPVAAAPPAPAPVAMAPIPNP